MPDRHPMTEGEREAVLDDALADLRFAAAGLRRLGLLDAAIHADLAAQAARNATPPPSEPPSALGRGETK